MALNGWNDSKAIGGDGESGDTFASLTESDRLLSALGAGSAAGTGEDPLAVMLADWRAELSAEPLPALPTAEQIAAAYAPNVASIGSRRGWVSAGDHHHGSRPKLWQAATGAAAVAAVLVGGLSVAAHNSQPGDPLWGVNKTIFSEHAGNVELVGDLSGNLAAADAAAQKGDRATAQRLLGEVSAKLDQVSDASDRVELMKRRDAIERELGRVTPSEVTSPEASPSELAVLPGLPNPFDPSLRTLVPVFPQLPTIPFPSVPVIPLPLDAINISTTLEIPIDPRFIENLLRPLSTSTSVNVPQRASIPQQTSTVVQSPQTSVVPTSTTTSGTTSPAAQPSGQSSTPVG